MSIQKQQNGLIPYNQIRGSKLYNNAIASQPQIQDRGFSAELNSPINPIQNGVSYSPTTIDTYKKTDPSQQHAGYLYGNQSSLVQQKHYVRMKQKNVNHQQYKQYGKYGQRSVDGSYQPSVGRGQGNNAKIEQFSQEYHAMSGAGSASSGISRPRPQGLSSLIEDELEAQQRSMSLNQRANNMIEKQRHQQMELERREARIRQQYGYKQLKPDGHNYVPRGASGSAINNSDEYMLRPLLRKNNIEKHNSLGIGQGLPSPHHIGSVARLQ